MKKSAGEAIDGVLDFTNDILAGERGHGPLAEAKQRAKQEKSDQKAYEADFDERKSAENAKRAKRGRPALSDDEFEELDSRRQIGQHDLSEKNSRGKTDFGDELKPQLDNSPEGLGAPESKDLQDLKKSREHPATPAVKQVGQSVDQASADVTGALHEVAGKVDQLSTQTVSTIGTVKTSLDDAITRIAALEATSNNA